jgi:hypothetical protein
MKMQVRALVSACALVLAPALAGAQSLAYNSGLNVAPGYEGWEQDPDGTKYFLFGYMNRNWQEEIDTPAGPENGFSPGPVDQGQPTHFLPRRNAFVFRVKVPANFGPKDELVWTLTTHGVTEKAYASLREDYKVDDVVKASEVGALGSGSSSPEIRANKPPSVKVDGPKTYTVKAGESLKLVATVTDDGVPKRGASPFGGAGVGGGNIDPARAAALQARIREFVTGPPQGATVHKVVGLHLSWFEYRGPVGGKVTYDPIQPKVWQDQRAGANSPWAPIWVPPTMPEDGKVSATVTFSEPGTYVLRALADDGALTAGDEVTVVVTK